MPVKKKSAKQIGDQTEGVKPRVKRADAQRKMASLLQSAAEIFTKSGVDAPVREIAERAGVGLGTVYRHFPQRSDLIVAVFQTQVDACADAASVLADKYEPAEALAHWLQRYVDFLTTKRGLTTALHSGDPAYAALPAYFDKRLHPALQGLLDTAVAANALRADIEAEELLRAVAGLCRSRRDEEPAYARKMVDLLVDGLRYRGASAHLKS
jgi:AcrR family transcriptional regulator